MASLNPLGLPRTFQGIQASTSGSAAGPFSTISLRRWACGAAEEAIAQRGDPGSHINVRTYRLSATARAELERELKRLHAEFQTRSMREELSMDREDLAQVRFVSVLAPGGFLKPRRS